MKQGYNGYVDKAWYGGSLKDDLKEKLRRDRQIQCTIHREVPADNFKVFDQGLDEIEYHQKGC